METAVLDVGSSMYLVNSAHLVRTDDAAGDIAANLTMTDWAVEKSSPFITWIGGDFVESDKPNQNKQFWTAGDLELAEYSIRHSPLNMVHKFRNPIGFFAATKTVTLDNLADAASQEILLPTLEEVLEARATDWGKTPSGADAPYAAFKRKDKFVVINNAGLLKATFDSKAEADDYLAALYEHVPGAAARAKKVPYTGTAKSRVPARKKAGDKASDDTDRMKIQALSGLWNHIFPFEAAQAEAADDEGLLFYSMECRGTHIKCAGDDGCQETFDYMNVASHCEHLKERASVRHIINPTFRGGALIVPPVKPGWKGASASILSDAVLAEAASFAEQNEAQYQSLAADGVNITASAWEQLMTQVVSQARP